jgi:DNA-binding CsgD family transcriptional regulator
MGSHKARGARSRDRSAAGLTAREAEILGLVRYGKTNRDVAAVLGLSSRTVQKHLEHIYEKLGVETRTAAVLAWQDPGALAP